jgi:hypothetical protein
MFDPMSLIKYDNYRISRYIPLGDNGYLYSDGEIRKDNKLNTTSDSNGRLIFCYFWTSASALDVLKKLFIKSIKHSPLSENYDNCFIYVPFLGYLGEDRKFYPSKYLADGFYNSYYNNEEALKMIDSIFSQNKEKEREMTTHVFYSDIQEVKSPLHSTFFGQYYVHIKGEGYLHSDGTCNVCIRSDNSGFYKNKNDAKRAIDRYLANDKVMKLKRFEIGKNNLIEGIYFCEEGDLDIYRFSKVFGWEGKVDKNTWKKVEITVKYVYFLKTL